MASARDPAAHPAAHPATHPAASHRSGTAWTVVAVSVVAGVVVAFGVGKLVAALPTISAQLGIGLTLGGFLLAAFSVVSAGVGVLLGTLIERIGARYALVGGLLLLAVGSAAGALGATGPHLLVTTVVEGAGFVAVVVAAPTLIARAAAARDSGLALGLWGTYMPAGQAIMIVLAPVLLAAWTWRGLWFAHAALVAACALIAWFVLAPDAPGRRGEASGRMARDVVAALRDRAPRLLALAFGLYALQFIAVTGFLPTVYAEQGFGAATSATLTGVVVVANVAGNLVAGALLRRGTASSTLILVATSVMGTAAIGVFGLGWPFAATYACAVAFSAIGGLLPGSVLAAVPVLVTDARLVPVTNGLIVQAIGIGMVIGPVAAAALAGLAGGWHATPFVATTAAVVIGLVAVRVRRLERRSPA